MGEKSSGFSCSDKDRPIELEPKRSPRSEKRLILIAFKCIISGSLIYWIMRGVNFSEISSTVLSANVAFLLFGLSLNFIGPYASAHRWRVLLKAHGIDIPTSFLIKSYMVGIFFNNLLPSTIGGDAIRAYDSWRIGKDKAGAVAVIFVDRLLGVLALMLFALSALLASNKAAANLPLLRLWVTVGTVGMFLLVWMIFLPCPRMLACIAKPIFPFWQKLHNIVKHFINAFLPFHGQTSALLKAFGLAIFVQGNVVLHYYFFAKALDLPVPLYNFFLIIPITTFIMMLPVSINGIGLRESAFMFFFSIFGASQAEAIALAWLAYGVVVFQGVLGGILYALRR